MPIFNVNGKRYKVREEDIAKFATDYPDAYTVIEDQGVRYGVKPADYKAFITPKGTTHSPTASHAPEDFLDADLRDPAQVEQKLSEEREAEFKRDINRFGVDNIPSTQQPQQPAPVEQTHKTSLASLVPGPMGTINSLYRSGANTPTPEAEQPTIDDTDVYGEEVDTTDYAVGFGEGTKEGWKGLVAGTQYFGGELANAITGTSRDDWQALQELQRRYYEGESLMRDEVPGWKKAWMKYVNFNSLIPESAKKSYRQILESDNINSLINDALEAANGDVTQARKILAEQSLKETWGDRQIEAAGEKLETIRPTKGFGAWAGNLIPQMIPTAAALAAGFLTKNPKVAQTIGQFGMGVMTASTAGMSMKEARDAGATNGEVWAAGIADGVIEYVSEKIPFNIYTRKIAKNMATSTSSDIIRLLGDPKSPAKDELEKLVVETNKRLGGKLLSGRNVKEYLASVAAEGLSEFSAEALQTMTPIIYEDPKNYPTIWNALKNGVEGFKAGIFMGAIMGGGSKAMEHQQQRSRRKQQGYVAVAQIDTDNGSSVGEVVGEKEGKIIALVDGDFIEVAPEKVGTVYEVPFEAFDKGVGEYEIEESYENGYTLQTPQEKNDARTMKEEQRKRVIEIMHLPEDTDLDEYLGDDPLRTILMMEEGTTQGERQALLDYVNAASTVEGMFQAVRDDIDDKIAQSDAQVDSRINKTDGRIHPATMKQDDRAVYIMSGEVVLLDDGTIDTANSSESIIVKDAETGKMEFSDPASLLNVGEVEDAEQTKEALREQIRQSVAGQAEAEILGTLAFAQGDTYVLTDEEGVQHQAQIVADNGDGTVQVALDGATEAVQMPKEQVQAMNDATNRGRAAAYIEQQNAQRESAMQEVAEEQQPIEEQPIEQPQEPQVEESALSRIPTDENGNQLFEQAPAQDTWSALVELNEGDTSEATDTAQQMLDNAKKELNKATSVKPKGGATVAEIQQDKAERKARIAEAQQKVDYWTEVLNAQQATQEQAAQEVAQAEKQEKRTDIPHTEEVDEYGNHFVLATDGSSNFGIIDAESGLKQAPIKLSMGENTVDDNGNNHGYGLLHIEAERGDAIRDAGYKSVQDFVESVAKNYTDIREGGIIANNQTYLLELVDEHNNTLFIQLSKSGEYWTINSAGIFRKKYSRNKRKVYDRPAVGPDTNTDISGVDSGHIVGVTTPAGNSPQTSDSKDTTSEPKNQEVEQEISQEEQIAPQEVAEQTQPATEQTEQETQAEAVPTQEQTEQEEQKQRKQQRVRIKVKKDEEARRKPLRKRAQAWAKKVGVEAVLIERFEDVENESARKAIQMHEEQKSGQRIPGWYSGGKVYIYLPHATDISDLDQTYIHEVVAHHGMKQMLGEEGYNQFCLKVWDMMEQTLNEQELNRWLAYQGVKGDKAKAADEYIAHLAETTESLTELDQSVWDKIVELLRDALRQLGFSLEGDAVAFDPSVEFTNKLIIDALHVSKRNLKQSANNQSESKQAEGADDINEKDGDAIFSIRTYEESGRANLKKFLKGQVKKKRITKADAEAIESTMEQMYETALQYKDVYAPFGTWSEAEVVKGKDGRPAFSVVKDNGEYVMNLDFSTVCKKRRTLDAVFSEMISRGLIDMIPMDGVQIAEINNIIRDYGFETACALCFVDAKRFRVAKVADKFCEMWNPMTKMSEEELRGVIKEYGDKKVIGKVAKYIMAHPEGRIELSRENLIDSKGFEQMQIDHPEILSLYKQAQGTSLAKIPFGDVQYLNDIEDRAWTPEAAYAVGGVRLQSFSYYIPRMFFDYMQMIAGLASKKLPVHAYTKEPIFAKQFGLTGIKINLSLVPKVVEGGVAAGLDAEGNYAWMEGETFPFEEAMALQNAEGYRENCGTIAVGVSDEHIEKMLDDPNIRMIIPYHKSNINPLVAKKNNIHLFKDYTLEQNTRNAEGKSLGARDKADMPNFNSLMHDEGMDARQAAQAYLDWCDSKGFIPKFDKWRDHPNYYKLLEDFTSIVPNAEGVETTYPQREVTMTFPDEDATFGSIEMLIREGLEEDAVLEGQREEKIGEIVDTIEKEMISFRTTYHGTPAIFERFDHSFMGSGEGNQAFGWGTYVTEEKGIGEWYAKVLTAPINEFIPERRAIIDAQIELDKAEQFSESIRKEIQSANDNIAFFEERIRNGASGYELEEAQENIENSKENILYNEQALTNAEDKIESARAAVAQAQEVYERARVRGNVYQVEIPDDNGHNYLSWEGRLTPKQMQMIASQAEKEGLTDIFYRDEDSGELVFNGSITSGEREYKDLVRSLGSDKAASEFLSRAGFTGIKYFGDGGNQDVHNYVIFNDADLEIKERTSFRTVPTFLSNAAVALEGIKQEKATPQQWLAMLKKAGGIKAGEDKWIGLSEWLEQSEAKTLTKQEVADFINENQIQIEETTYSSNSAVETTPEFKALQEEFKQIAKGYEDEARRNLDEYEAKLAKKYNLPENYFDTTVLNSDESKANSSLPRIIAEKIYNAAWADLVDKYGDDFEIAFWRGYDVIRVDDAEAAGVLLGLPIDRPIHHLREDYTTKGLEGNREIALTIPTIESWNEGDLVHFGDAGEGRAIAWIRFGETTDKDGKRVLVIDEIQSKRHQEGREKGYRPSDVDKYLKDNNVEVVETGEFYEFYRDGELDRRFSKGLLHYNIKEAKNLYVAGYNKSNIPEAPFEKNWAELAMKRMLRYAAEHGFDKVAWTKGDQQSMRYGLANKISKIHVYKHPSGYKVISLDYRNRTEGIDDYYQMSVDENGKITQGDFVGRDLSEVVGKDLAVKLMAVEDRQTFSGDGLVVSNEGMRAFYDQMLPSFMRKYAKKWGATVQDVTLPNVEEAGRTMHSVDVTDSMRESVMQGQTMFRMADAKKLFKELEERYEKLDKSDTEALNKWRDEKAAAIQSVITAISDELNLECPIIVFNGENEDSMQEVYGYVKTMYDEVGKKFPYSYEKFRDRVSKKGNLGKYWPYVDIVTSNTSNYDYLTDFQYSRAMLMHENAHHIIRKSYTSGDLEAIWDEAVSAKHPLVLVIEKFYSSRTNAGKGNELLARIIGNITSRKGDDVIAYIKGEKNVEQSLLENSGYSLPLGRFALSEILNTFKNDYGRRGDRDLRRGAVGILHIPGGHTANRIRRKAVKEAAELFASQLNTPINIVERISDITDPNPRLQSRKRAAKGWYDATTKQVVVVLPNAVSVEDVRATIFHEVVGHKGLRETVGEKRYNAFLEEVYRGASPAIRERIARRAATLGWDFNLATDEYLASLAEQGFEERENRNFFEVVRDLFLDLLSNAKIALGYRINDNDIRYMLWRTYQMQRSKGVMGIAEDMVMQQKLGVGNFTPNDTRFRVASEREQIVEKAKADGTYLKAPNGKPTNLTPEQWVTVRTKAFKRWFGDWEKAARIEKLRESESVDIPSNANEGLFELNRTSVREYIMNNLRGEYTNKDTGETIEISRRGAQKVTSHSVGSEAHLKSVVAIPEMLRNAIFIDEVSAEKDNAHYDSYRYYICGLRIGSEDYTVRITIGVKGNKFYYDHALTDIEKGNLIEIAQGFKASGGRTLPSYAKGKDTRIIPLLQTNSSKILDANGEPKVVYHQTNAKVYINRETGQNWDELDWRERMEWDERDDWEDYWIEQDFTKFSRVNARVTQEFDGFFFAPEYDEFHEYGDRTIVAFLNIRKPASREDYNIDSTQTNAGREERLRLQSEGFDGVIREYDGAIDEYVAFYPNQIKLADDSNTTFDPDNDDVRMRETEAPSKQRANYNDPAYIQEQIDKLKSYAWKAKQTKTFRRELANLIAGRMRALVGRELAEQMGVSEFNALTRQMANATVSQDVIKPLERIEEIVANLAIKKADASLKRLLEMKIQGENKTGVSVAKTVDDATRQVVEYVKANMGTPTAELLDRLNERIDEVDEAKAAVELTGIDILRMIEGVQSIDRDIAEINEQIQALREANTTARNMRTMYNQDGKAAEAQKQTDVIAENNELISALESERVAKTKSKLQQLNAVVGALQSAISKGQGAYQSFVAENIRQNAEMMEEALMDIDTGKTLEMYDRPKKGLKKAWAKSIEFLISPANSLLHLIRKISVNAPNGEGYLFDTFIRGKNGYIEASNRYKDGVKSFVQALDEAAKRFLGKPYAKVLEESSKQTGVIAPLKRGNRIDPKPLNFGEALYFYMVNKMADGKVKLRSMGISEEFIEMLADGVLANGYTQFADWVQEEFLPQRRKAYNDTHTRVFGTQMAEIEHYIPLRVRKVETHQEVDGSKDEDRLPTTMTGSIINRRRNNVILDVNTNVFDLLLNHGQEMEHWNAYTPVVKAMNALLTNTRIRLILNQRQDGLHTMLKEAAQVASDQFNPKANIISKALIALSTGLNASKINFRVWTAMKQILSFPAFLTYSSDTKFFTALAKNIKELAVPKKGGVSTWEWGIQNLPSLRERWESRNLGNERLAYGSGIDIFDKMTSTTSYYGMLPNAFVDMLACTVGAKAVYDYKYEAYKTEGYSDEEADRLAKIDATVMFNETQQSAESLFLSPIQRSRDYTSAAFNLFRNASFGYLRKMLDGIYELRRDKANETKFLEQIYLKKGFNADEARRLAERNVSKTKMKAKADIAMFGFILNILWVAGGSILPYIFLSGDDDDEEKSMMRQAAELLIMSPLENTIVGPAVATLKEGYNFYIGTLTGTINQMNGRIQQGEAKKWDQTAAYLVLRHLVASATGADIDVAARMYEGIDGAIKDGVDTEDVLSVLNTPVSQTRAIASEPHEGETIDAYLKRMADVERRLDSKVSNSQTNRWIKNFYNYRLSDALDRPYVRDLYGRVTIPVLNEYKAIVANIEEEYKAAIEKGFEAEVDFVNQPRYEQMEFIKEYLDIIDDAHKVLRNPEADEDIKAEMEKEMLQAAQELIKMGEVE